MGINGRRLFVGDIRALSVAMVRPENADFQIARVNSYGVRGLDLPGLPAAERDAIPGRIAIPIAGNGDLIACRQAIAQTERRGVLHPGDPQGRRLGGRQFATEGEIDRQPVVNALIVLNPERVISVKAVALLSGQVRFAVGMAP